MKKKILIIIIACLQISIIVFYVVAFSNLENAKQSGSNAWERKYLHGYFTNEQKKDIFNEVNIDIERLSENGFEIFNDNFLISADDKKTLMKIQLNFEKVYCHVSIAYSEKEIEWDKEVGSTIGDASVNIGNKIYKYAYNTLVYRNPTTQKTYSFYCGLPYTDVLYQEFLIMFFKKV